ncbi:glucagon-like peptide 1 receptor [Lethenteron reissneri]|uniref:glucagon-like peptide 1 receptor n=1 Tax=Lethenteron reissneri TaxID=7753 RepID=UPI002AB789F0|nr:glucagon-like peptide 1 receptor [Lethenteron reissneri]
MPQSPRSMLSRTVERWKEYRTRCLDEMESTPYPSHAAGRYCNRTFDSYVCWPDGLPGQSVNVSCPPYLPWSDSVWFGRAYRFCSADGTWLRMDGSNETWRNVSECEDRTNQEEPRELLSLIHAVYTVGHSLSLAALLLASAILLLFRRLHCTRNYIHLNLFLSFILRAISILVKDAVLRSIYASDSDTGAWDEVLAHQESAACKAVFVLMQYCVAANYYWLLVEGVYLHTLLALAVFSERRSFKAYVAIGWGAPVLFVVPWVVVKQLNENVGCWTRNYNMNYWLIIRLPIIAAIAVNFFIFVKIICLVVSKLRANLMCRSDIKCRGAEHADNNPRHSPTHEHPLALAHGLLVAILYCFINSEVQAELRKTWERWRLERGAGGARDGPAALKPMHSTLLSAASTDHRLGSDSAEL